MKTNSDSLAQNAVLRSAFGPYRLVGEIGRGGMATVFLAIFSNGDGTARPAVLKQLSPSLANDRDVRTMFEDEARLATRLHHDNVVETYDVYCDPDLCVLLMEFLEGQTLSRVRQTAHRMGNLPLPIQLHCLAEVLAGLDYVHELTDERGAPLRIVHRDVTPSNVLVTYRGTVKVVDFGIAKASTRLAETRVGVLKGKLVYMSPEAVRGEPVDRRSDIFSVGVMLWEAVTGRRLWQDHDELSVLRHLGAGLIPLRAPSFAVSDPDAFAIAERALATDPNQRYATAAEMRRDIEALLARRGATLGASTLSGYMQSCFAEERRKLQALVDEALGGARQPASPPPFMESDLPESEPTVETTEPPTTVSLPPAPFFRTVTVPGVRPAPTRADWPWQGLLLATGSVALAVAVAFIAHFPRAVQATSSVPSVAAAAVAVAAGPVPSSAPNVLAESVATTIIDADLEVAPANVTLVFSARPAEARFSIDGERLDGNPVTLRREADDKLHRLRIEAPGFIPFSRSFRLNEDTTRVFDLVRKPPPAPRVQPVDAQPAASSDCPNSRRQSVLAK